MVLHIFGGEVPGGNATTLWDSPVTDRNCHITRDKKRQTPKHVFLARRLVSEKRTNLFGENLDL